MKAPRTHAGTRRAQRGAFIITAALLLLFLLGFMGIAVDFGHLFVVKSELQTAMDSCALAAARELDGQGTATTPNNAIARAQNAGFAAGNLNNVNMQSGTWSGQGKIVAADITFRDAGYSLTTVPAAARYVQCQHTQPNVAMMLMHAIGAFTGDTANNPNTRNVWASAVATRGSAQSSCAIPIALEPKAGGTAPDYGFTVGEWVTLLHQQNAAQGGQIGWANLDGSNNAAETQAEMNGTNCLTAVADTLGTPGVQTAVADNWNYRFGIYKSNAGPASYVSNPDFTGYAYTSTNWPSQANAYNGAPGAGAHATAQNYVTKSGINAACAPNGNVKGANSCEAITGLQLNGGFQTLATPAQHLQYGRSRRLVTVPVINSANSKVIDFACMFILHPLSVPMSDAKLEYRGSAGAVGSPCSTGGIPGGTAGPLVPVLVR
jgi:Flp pilus assembly protein TadG